QGLFAPTVSGSVKESVTSQDLDNASQLLNVGEKKKVLCKFAIGAVLYHNSATELRTFLDSIQTNKQPDNLQLMSLFFHGNDSWSEQQLSSLVQLRGCVFSHSLENIGFARAHNQLMERAFTTGLDYYVAANPDGIFHPECIRNLLGMAQQLEGKALV